MNRHPLPAAAIVPSLLIVAPTFGSASIDRAVADADDFLSRQPNGWYVRASGMVVDQQDARLRDRTPGQVIEAAAVSAGLPATGWELESDTGFGLTVATGYRFENSPLSLELEYSYRSADFDRIAIGDSAAAEGEGDVHALMLNVMADWKLGFGRLGAYVGGGVGLARTSGDLDAIDGVGLPIESDSDTTFAWQAMAGLTWTLTERSQLYGGIRYFDAGDVDFELLGSENASFNYELGLRFFF